jgi:hypothetical protein
MRRAMAHHRPGQRVFIDERVMHDKGRCNCDRLVDQHLRHVLGNPGQARQRCRSGAAGIQACFPVKRNEEAGKPGQILARRVIEALKPADGCHQHRILAADAIGPFEIAETV